MRTRPSYSGATAQRVLCQYDPPLRSSAVSSTTLFPASKPGTGYAGPEPSAIAMSGLGLPPGVRGQGSPAAIAEASRAGVGGRRGFRAHWLPLGGLDASRLVGSVKTADGADGDENGDPKKDSAHPQIPTIRSAPESESAAEGPRRVSRAREHARTSGGSRGLSIHPRRLVLSGESGVPWFASGSPVSLQISGLPRTLGDWTSSPTDASKPA